MDNLKLAIVSTVSTVFDFLMINYVLKLQTGVRKMVVYRMFEVWRRTSTNITFLAVFVIFHAKQRTPGPIATIHLFPVQRVSLPTSRCRFRDTLKKQTGPALPPSWKFLFNFLMRAVPMIPLLIANYYCSGARAQKSGIGDVLQAGIFVSSEKQINYSFRYTPACILFGANTSFRPGDKFYEYSH